MVTNSPGWSHLLHRADVAGALVLTALPGTPAEENGLDRGDVIVSFDHDEVRSLAEYSATAAATINPNHTLSVVSPDGIARSVVVKLSETSPQVQEYIDSLTRAPSDPVDQYLLAAGGHDVSLAIRSAKSLVSAYPEFGLGYILQAQRSLQAGGALGTDQLSLIRRTIETGLERDPASADVQLGATFVYSTLGDLKAGEDHATLAIQLEPGSPEAHHTLGLIQEKQGRVNDALPELWRAVKLDTLNAGYYRDLARIYIAAGRSESAKATEIAARHVLAHDTNSGTSEDRRRVALNVAILVGGFLGVALLGFRRVGHPEADDGILSAPSIDRELVLLETLGVLGLLTIAIPILVPIVDLKPVSTFALEAANYYVPGVLLCLLSAIGIKRSYDSNYREAPAWMLIVGMVSLLCALWLLAGHMGLMVRSIAGTQPWSVAFYYCSTVVPVLVVSGWLSAIGYRGFSGRGPIDSSRSPRAGEGIVAVET
jgi:tetratricopeptide (TPR) repeat protein